MVVVDVGLVVVVVVVEVVVDVVEVVVVGGVVVVVGGVVVVVVVVVVVPETPGDWAAATLIPDIEKLLRIGTAAAPMAARLRNVRRSKEVPPLEAEGPDWSVDVGKPVTGSPYEDGE